MTPSRAFRHRSIALIAVFAAMMGAGCGQEGGATTTVTVAEPAETQTVEPTPAQTPEATPTPAATPQPAARPSRVSRRRAIRIARRKVGGGRVTEVERDGDDGRAVWEIEIDRGRTDHKVTVAVRGGRVVDHDRDRDDDGDD
jgi:uncharacterized membrane protein YkoI